MIWVCAVVSGIVLLCVACLSNRSYPSEFTAVPSYLIREDPSEPGYRYVYNGTIVGLSGTYEIRTRAPVAPGSYMGVLPHYVSQMTPQIYVCKPADSGTYAQSYPDGVIDLYGCFTFSGYQELIAGIVLLVA
ncbi:MAG: hypothetical protein ACYCOU_04555 [Sulfobacillus sp.]